MIYWIRTSTPVWPKKAPMDFAIRYTRMINEKVPGATAEFCRRMTGNIEQVMFIVKFESLTEAEKFHETFAGIDEVQALMKESVEVEEARGTPLWKDTEDHYYYVTEPRDHPPTNPYGR